jgi:uncharacterized protein with FMN-binding domain
VKRIALWFSATTTAVMLLFGYHTSLSGPATAQSTGTVAAAGIVTETPVVTTSPSASPSTSPSTSAGTTTTSTTKTVNGAAVSTRYGDIQVQIVVSGSKIVKATAIAYSTRGKDGEINAYAIPTLQTETLTAQGAGIDTVSGATFTSDGYRQSLQSALDAL